ncbi:hypothetical protein GE061_015688 [Apolygus lucorum]|uniref:Uncharacterized protein n=1 Tax=Apolygus lucorum TaxID=248454 RepID=A0A8S9XMV3_APOLU|nr:hypothetical protein GE061_015688 [Apolygus lucorum]
MEGGQGWSKVDRQKKNWPGQVLRTPKLRLPDLYKDFYKTSHGYLSETGSYKWPLILQDNPLQYNEIYSGVLWGNSLENYAFKGHNVTMPWAVLQQSTGSLRFTFDYLYEILDAVPLRALIITANYLNGFTKNVLTVDLLVENLPSGFCSARTKITSSLLEPKSSYLLELLILVLICGLLLVVIFVALYNAYFDDFWKKAISFPIVLVVTGVTYVDFKRRYSIHDKLIFNPADSYLDLHIFHEEGQDANLFLMFIPLLVFLDTLWTIRSVIGTHVFRMKLLSRVHNFVVGYILGNLLWQVVIITVPEKDSRPISVMMEFYYSKSTKSYDLELQSFQIMVVIIAVSIFHKVVMAPVICEYYYTKEAFKIDGDNLFGRIIKNCLKHDKRQKRAEYKNTEPDHKHSVRWFHIHRKVHYIHPKSEFEPTTRTTTTTISTKESIDGLENRSIDRNQHHSSVISSGLLSKLRYLEDNK